MIRQLACAALIVLACAWPGHGAAAALPSAMIDGAKREGAVVWYTTTDQPTITALEARFKQRYPEITVQTLRLSTAEITPRVLTEQRGGLYNADLISGEESQLTLLLSNGALAPYRPSEADRYIKGSVEPSGAWTSIYSDTTVIAWNTQRLHADGLRAPRTTADLTRPEYHGHIGLNTNAFAWYLGLVNADPKARELVAGIAANQPFFTTSHTGTMTELEAGEFSVTPTVYGYLAAQEKNAGRPIDFVNPVPLLVTLAPLAIAKNAPHPNAARLFDEFVLSREGQQIIVDVSGRSSSRTDVRQNASVFDPRRPYIVVHALEPAAFTAAVKDFRTLLGLP